MPAKLKAHPEPQYIVDSDGNRQAVVLSVDDYEEMLEDLHDLAVVAERKDEGTVPWSEVEARLRRDGLL